MFEDVDKRLQRLEKANTVHKTPAEPIMAEKPSNPTSSTFETKVRAEIKNNTIVEVFEQKDGTLVVKPAVIADRSLVFSMCANAVLFVLLITKLIGLW